MNNFNSYTGSLDFSFLKSLFITTGKKKIYSKKDFFIFQNDKSQKIAYVEQGVFQYLHNDSDAREHVVGFAFADEFVCDYSSLMKESPSLVSIQALADCYVYELPSSVLLNYWDNDYESQRQGRLAAENLYELAYKRFLDTYSTSELRYKNLMKRCPLLKELLPLKSIASYLGVSPETVSHIRKKILYDVNS